ncbi:MAG: glycoside hydrolase family 13 protein [Bacillota bacterium]|nr:glycoside hydrolase family 13 protein [Bacillota bacterium]MDW7677338.1 glycoside hydrolase family 13 protein [Bacillota bacterium]
MIQDMLFHHSHQSFYRSPFGAVPVSEKVRLRLSGTLLPSALKVYVRLWREGVGEEMIPMNPLSYPEPRLDTWEVEFVPSQKPGLVWYFFIIEHAEGFRYYGNNVERLGGQGQMQLETPYSWQITVHQQDLSVPDWFLRGIIYQIFPDRFYNGLPSRKVRHPKKNSFLYGNWEDDPIYIKDPATGKILRWDFHGGNLEGIIAKLSYLKELGVSILYLNPIFEAASNHRYDTGDYKKIDPMLGSEKTFELLCQKAADLEIRVILDGVFSHTGSDSRYFNREGHYDTLGAYHSKNSPYYPWYRFKHYPDTYECWWGIDNMPNINELEHSFRNFIIEDEDNVIRRWINKGAGGWRLDVADELPSVFIRQVRRAMKATDAESVLIGEVWEDASNKVSYGERRSYLLGEELDSVMNYPFRKAMIDFLMGRISGDAAAIQLMSLYENYPRVYFYSCMNLIGSHDRARILTLLGDAPDESGMNTLEKLQYRLPVAQRSIAKARLKALMAFQMTFPGVPSIYYGDEAGVEGFTDPLNRKTYPWGKEDHDLLEWTKRMTRLRNEHNVFIHGDWNIFSVGDHHLAISRSLKGNIKAVTILNRHPHLELSIREKVPLESAGVLRDVETGKIYQLKDGWLTIEIQPMTAVILVVEDHQVMENNQG